MKLSPEQRRRLRQAFRMPSVQTMVARTSTITNAFVYSLIPVLPPSEEEIHQALDLLGMTAADLRCAYCGSSASEWDHLRPLVVNRRPTGYISEIGNLVPSCGKCNQSKGNKAWESWMRSNAPHSPASRGVTDLEIRVNRLRHYEKWRYRCPIDFESIVSPEMWRQHWENLDQVIALLQCSQQLAVGLRDKIREQLATDPPDA